MEMYHDYLPISYEYVFLDSVCFIEREGGGAQGIITILATWCDRFRSRIHTCQEYCNRKNWNQGTFIQIWFAGQSLMLTSKHCALLWYALESTNSTVGSKYIHIFRDRARGPKLPESLKLSSKCDFEHRYIVHGISL